MSQTDFAKALDVSYTTVSRWENGKSVPNYQTLKKLDSFIRDHALNFDIRTVINDNQNLLER